MEKPYEQNLANHARFVFWYHGVLLLLVFANMVWRIYRLIVDLSGESVMQLVVAVALGMAVFYARIFALRAQDRVIRLEETERMERILPQDLKLRIGEFTSGQLIALRFAADGEVSELARKVLDEKITSRKEIKKQIRQWRPDFHRL